MPPMLDETIRSRRTHKLFQPEPVPAQTLAELFELARWAPNHKLTNPWRFRVVGPQALLRLKTAAGESTTAPGKLDRAPTLVVASAIGAEDPVIAEENEHATAAAVYILLLAAHDRGLAGYWRSPAVLRTAEGRAAVSVPETERVLGLIHLGRPVREQEPPERAAIETFVEFLE